MKSFTPFICLFGQALAASVFLNEPDTGIDDAMAAVPVGTLPDILTMHGIPDFDWAARHVLNVENYTQFRYGAAGEYSYRNNLEVYHRYRFRPRVLVDVTNIESTFNTTILGHTFAAPLFISPCANAGQVNPVGEGGLVVGAQRENILYIASQTSSLTMGEIAAQKAEGQVVFQQVSLTGNMTETAALFKKIEDLGSKAIVFTVDSAADRTRHRALRYVEGFSNIPTNYDLFTWGVYKQFQSLTSLPIIPKGIQTWEDAQLAVANGAKAIILSNHGGRVVDDSPSPLEVALEIHNNCPEIFGMIDVLADGGVRYGTDALKLMALGVKAVGMGRPYMFANAYGADGVARAAQLMKREIAVSAGSIGVGDLKMIDSTFVNWDRQCTT